MNESIPYIEQNRANFWKVLFIYVSIFINSYVFFKEPFEFYLGYIIYIFLLPGFIIRYPINKSMVGIFIILIINGVLNIVLGNDTSAQFIKIFFGLLLSYFFYYYVINEFKFDIEQLFIWYMYGCYISALIGLFQYISFLVGFKTGLHLFYVLNKWGPHIGGTLGIRINSIFAEPTHLATVLSAAFFVSVYNMFSLNTFGLSRKKCAIIITVYLMSFSGVGQISIFLTLFFLAISYGLIRYILILIPVTIVLFNYLYANVAEFKSRLDGMISMFSGEEFKLGETHGSSFILYNNYVVALKNFATSPIFGAGIGSHPVAFEKYSIAKNMVVWGFNLNGADANSMFLRLLSETGLFGLGIFLMIIIKCYVKKTAYTKTNNWLISNAILIMILLNLFRQGHYFLNGFPFFLMLYYYNSVAYRTSDEYQNS